MQRLSVIIPHSGAAFELVGCLTALKIQSVQPDEIIVVCNNEGDNSAEIRAVVQAICGSAIVIHESQMGAGLARNAGVARSSGEWLAFVDSDCRPAPDWVALGRRALETIPLFGGQVTVVAAPGSRPTPVEAFDVAFGFDARKFLRRSGHLLTTNLFCTRAVFDRVGPFRNLVPEDKEWSWRATAAGFALAVEPTVAVEHPALATWTQLASRWHRMTREEYVFGRERRFGLLRFWLRSWLVLGSVFPHGVRLLWTGRFRIVSALRVIVILARIRTYRLVVAQKLIRSGRAGPHLGPDLVRHSGWYQKGG